MPAQNTNHPDSPTFTQDVPRTALFDQNAADDNSLQEKRGDPSVPGAPQEKV